MCVHRIHSMFGWCITIELITLPATGFRRRDVSERSNWLHTLHFTIRGLLVQAKVNETTRSNNLNLHNDGIGISYASVKVMIPFYGGYSFTWKSWRFITFLLSLRRKSSVSNALGDIKNAQLRTERKKKSRALRSRYTNENATCFVTGSTRLPKSIQHCE